MIYDKLICSFVLTALLFTMPANAQAQDQILLDVPFLSQAPTFQWSDDRFQSGCEEASVLMALAWAGVRQLPHSQKAQAKAILDLVAFEESRWGGSHDTSTADTVRFMREYSGYTKISVKYGIRWRDVLGALESGSLVLVPADGRKLKNPNFKGLGPQEHMLVVRGYDYVKEEFITNDPGTRHGKEYRYPRSVLQDAIRDYKTGKKEKGRPRIKAMIVVDK